MCEYCTTKVCHDQLVCSFYEPRNDEAYNNPELCYNTTDQDEWEALGCWYLYQEDDGVAVCEEYAWNPIVQVNLACASIGKEENECFNVVADYDSWERRDCWQFVTYPEEDCNRCSTDFCESVLECQYRY